MKRNSVFAVAREAMRQHSGWGRTWGNPEAKKTYDVVIIGAGGVERIVEIDLNAEEQVMFDNSVGAVKALNDVVDGLEK